MLQAAGDPEKSVTEWQRTGTPTGASCKIPTHGVFPTVDKASAAVEASKAFALIRQAEGFSAETHKNYKSFYEEEGKHAKEELQRIAELGFVEYFDSWRRVVGSWPGAVASKIACLVKARPDGTSKIRLMTKLANEKPILAINRTLVVTLTVGSVKSTFINR